jgi:hypothetical protein
MIFFWLAEIEHDKLPMHISHLSLGLGWLMMKAPTLLLGQMLISCLHSKRRLHSGVKFPCEMMNPS